MQVVKEFSFDEQRVPQEWTPPLRTVSFQDGTLASGPAATFRVPLPDGLEFDRIRIEITLVRGPGGTGAVSVGDGMLTTVVDLTGGRHRVSFYGSEALIRSTAGIPHRTDAHLITIDIGSGRIAAAVDGTPVLDVQDSHCAQTVSGLFTLGFHENCFVKRVRFLSDSARSVPPQRSRGGRLQLRCAVDFIDDLIAAPFSDPMLDQLFSHLVDAGVERCQWMYYGKRADGWWDHAGNGAAHAAETMKRLGGEIFPAAVRAAHRHGISIHAVLKPFDMGFYYSYGLAMPEASRYGRLDRIGGPKTWMPHFVAQNQHLLMRRKPDAFGPSLNDCITRIDVVKEDDLACDFDVDALNLYVSDDNTTYRKYEGAIERTEVVEPHPVWEHTPSGGRETSTRRRCRIMRLSGLRITEPYFAVAVDSRAQTFANSLINLFHVFGQQGEERRLTYGLVERSLLHLRPDDSDASEPKLPTPDFRRSGVEFDVNPGMPSAVQPGFDPIRARHVLDGDRGFVAFARGKDAGPIGALSPSFPETRNWWTSWLRDALNDGADGIELRVRSHNYCLAWSEFGFESPTVQAYREHYGVDLLRSDDFDRAALRRLRGEFYTQFVREARSLATEFGREFALQISPSLEMDPTRGGAMDMHWDWRTWLGDGAHSVTLKETWPGTRLHHDIAALAQTHQTRLSFSPFAVGILRTPGGERVLAKWLDLASAFGCHAFECYESAAMFAATSDGDVHWRNHEVRDVLRQHARLPVSHISAPAEQS